MLLIGLVGGTEAKREAVAQCLIRDGRQQLVSFAVNGYRLAHGRANTLARALDNARAGRQPVQGMVIPHVLTEAEDELIRKRGGFVWHLAAPISAVVPIQRGDLLVTPVAGGVRHYLDPLEALSETLLKQQERQASRRIERRA